MTKTLLDMPDVAITEIMSFLDYMSIQNTKKTCWKLRNFLKAVQFDPRIRSISFYEREDRIIATMSTEKVWNGMEGRSVRLQYMTKEDGCKVTWQPTRHEQKVTIVKNEHYKDVFWRDLKILLTSVRTTLRSFSVTTHNSIHQNVFATKLEKILKLRREAIQVETISIDAFNPTEVAQILQCFDSKPLVWLVINNTQSTDAVMDITEIVRLDHWKQAKHVTMDSWRFPSVQMKHFAHFQISDIHYTNFIAHKIKIVKEVSNSGYHFFHESFEMDYFTDQNPVPLKTTLEMNVIVQIEHWKNIEEFYVEGLVVNASVRNFAHISRLKTKIMTMFMTTTIYKNHVYDYKKFEDKEQLDNIFGPLIIDPEDDGERNGSSILQE
ncbi:hypothetical protein CRE_03194 [Caenorhabditis remanei]|uniref:F-box domain-containing protein n=1 Tax=Caenorhabditis remanei TaxID=31234 RepID=E3MMN2_CAERE|nr:hypothetical protein CRE_03194 [Caenorhabditis remanei]